MIFHENIFPYYSSLSSTDPNHNEIDMHSFYITIFISLLYLQDSNDTSIVVSDSSQVIVSSCRTSLRVKNKTRYLDQYYCGFASPSQSILSTSYPTHLFLSYGNAFLHGDLHEEIYMKPPSSLSLAHLKLVCKLHKFLYDLK